jgi:RNA polymerase sigma-70 factor (ECF subfamily)
MPTEGDIARLYDAHAAALFAFALSLSRSEADARDLLQDAFLKIARKPSLLRGVRDERAFLLRLIHNAAVDLMRRRRVRATGDESDAHEDPVFFAPAENDPDEAAFRAALSEALSSLPPDQRVVVHLKLWEGLTFESIAELLQIPLNTAASRYRYGLDKLRVVLRPLYDELR